MKRLLVLTALVCLALALFAGSAALAEAEAAYTVEFHHDGLEYVLPGGASAPMSEILGTLGLSGDVTAAEVSDAALFSASDASGEWIVTAHQAFSTDEWMKVTLDGAVYEIAVTDQDLSGFLDCTSGSATGYFTFSDHFYKVEWTGINTAETHSIRLDTDSYNRLVAYRNGDASATTFLRADATSSTAWPTSSITNLTVGQSSSGYTSFWKLATGADDKNRKKVCTVTCVASLKPKWSWADDHKSCTATFFCAADPSVTATVNATITQSIEPLAANATFNGQSYAYKPTETYNINYVLNGGTNAAANPTTYRDDEAVTLEAPTRTGYIFEGWYNNARFNGSPITDIPYDSSGDKTFYAKWRDEIDGLHYDAGIGGFVIDSVETLNTLVNYSQTNGCGGKVFKQTADIALSGNFNGIGSYDHRFSGTYDGGSHYITGLYKKEYVNYLGLFRMTRNATIENVRVVSPYIDSCDSSGAHGGTGIGGVIGTSDDTTVRNCYVLNPTLKGDSSTGAIIGWKLGGTCSDCYYYATSDSSLSAIGRSGDSATGRLRKVVLASEHVTISGNAVKLFYDGAYYVTDDSPLTLTVTPDTGYELSELAVKQGTAVVALGETENANEYTFEMPPTGDVTVEATFARIEYAIDYNYNLEGVNIPAGNPATYNIDSETITLINPTRAGYAFTGWTGSNGTTPQKTVTIPHGSIGDKAYTANWMEDHWGIAAGNDGSAEHPYTIGSVEALNYLAEYVNSGNSAGGLRFRQTADLTLTGNFTPIGGQNGGYNATAFAGVYDGDAHTITGLTVNASAPYAGLFGYIQGGTVKNLTVINPNVRASYSNTRYAGGIVGCVKPGYIENCKVLNPTLSATYCGAICGGICARSTSISGCYFYAPTSVGVGMNNLQVPLTVTRVNTLTLGEGITANANSIFSLNGTAYYTEGTSVTLGHTERDGYSFSYVAKGSDNSSVTVADDQFTFPAKDVTVTAAYAPIVYDITYNGVEGATFATTFNSYTVESEAITLDRPSNKTGYTFGGWYDLNGDAIATIPANSTGNVELWAKWTANTYTIHFEPNSDRVFYEDNDGHPLMPDQIFHYDQPATALTANAFHMTTGEWLGWNTRPDGEGTAYADEAQLHNLTAEDGTVITLYAQWRQMHRFNYNSSIFSCKNLTQTSIHPDTPEVYWAYEGDTVQVLINDYGNEYTVSYTAADGTPVLFDDTTSTFTMPNQEVWITVSDSLKKIDYNTRIHLDGFDYWDDVAYLYDPDHPTVTPAVMVTELDDETVLTEGVDYTYSIINNTGSPSELVTATVTVTGMGDYIGVAKTEFRITPFNIANCEIRGTLESYNDGYGPYYPLTNRVQVWNGDTQLEYDADYIIELDPDIGVYNYKVGETYQATICGRGDWCGTKTFTFAFIELYHTVVFDANGGTGEIADDRTTYNSYMGNIYYLPECAFTAPRGMEFDHWEADCELDEYEEPVHKDPGDYFTGPSIWTEENVTTITVTAIWKEKTPFAISAPGMENGVLLVLVDGETEALELIDDTARVYDGDLITIVPKDGYTLSQDDISVTYYDEEEVEHTVDVSPDQDIPGGFSFTMPAANVDVAAELVPIPEYTVSFAANGGSGNMAPETLRVDTEYTLPDCGFTAPADKLFLEWSVQIGESAAAIMAPGDTFTVTADTTVTAMWVNLYSITVVTKGEGTLTPSKTKAVAGEVITLTANPGEGYALTKRTDKLYAIYAHPNGSTEKLASFDREDLSLTTPEGNVTVYAAFISPWEQLQEALSAGGTVTLDRNYAATATDNQLYIPEGTTVTLDLNGHTLDASATDYNVISVYGALILQNSKGGGRITGGSNDGAGVQVSAGASFTMNGGEISGNAVGRNDGMGGGVYVSRDGSFTMNGGTITGNSASIGGGVFTMGSFTMTGGTITGNAADDFGGGVAAFSSITLSGAARIYDNGPDDVALVYAEDEGEVLVNTKIVVGGPLTGAAVQPIAVECITDGDAPDAMVFTEGLSGNGSLACFTSVDSYYRLLRLNSDGEAELYDAVDILTQDEDGNPVYNAWTMVLDAEEDWVVDQWPSGEGAHRFSEFCGQVPYILRAQAPAGYETPEDIAFSIDESGVLTAEDGAIDENGALVMTFHIASYDLTLPEVIEGGQVTVTVNGEEATTAHMDDTVCVTFLPAEGFGLSEVDAVRADGEGIYVNWADDYLSFSFSMPDQSVSLPVEFRRVWAGADFTLPQAIAQVDEEAFTGIGATAVLVPASCESIGARAFANCDNLEAIRIENAHCEIGQNAFAGCDHVWVFAPWESPAQAYAETHDNCEFVGIDSVDAGEDEKE